MRDETMTGEINHVREDRTDKEKRNEERSLIEHNVMLCYLLTSSMPSGSCCELILLQHHDLLLHVREVISDGCSDDTTTHHHCNLERERENNRSKDRRVVMTK